MLEHDEIIALQIFQILCIFVLQAKERTGFDARNTKIYKFHKLRKAIFSAIFNVSQPNFAIFSNFDTLFLAVVTNAVALAWISALIFL